MSRRPRRWTRPHRMVRPVRPFRPVRSVFHFFWSLFWLIAGLALAFSPEFRTMFIQFWVGFAHMAASLARGLAGLFTGDLPS